MKRAFGIGSVLLGILLAVAPAHAKTKPKVDLAKHLVKGEHFKEGKIISRDAGTGQTTANGSKLRAVKGTHIPETKLQDRDAGYTTSSSPLGTGRPPGYATSSNPLGTGRPPGYTPPSSPLGTGRP
jgi:hypothetical protein